MKDINVSRRKTLLQSDCFEVKEERILLPTGEEKIHKNVYKHDAVSIFPITPNYKIYLIKQYRYLYQKTILEAVAGYVDNGESSLTAAKRELKEEAGLTASDWEEIGRVEMASSVFKGTQYLFLTRNLELGDATPEPSEQIELVKMPLEEALEKIMLGEIRNSSTMIGIFILDKLKQQKKL